MTLTKIPPLAINVPICDPDTGCPTPYLQRLLDVLIEEKNETDAQADEATTDIEDLADTVSNLILDDLSDVNLTSNAQGDILYRAAGNEWKNLAPGTSGNLLQTNGAAANPSWVTPATGAAWTEIAFWDFSITGAVASVIGNVTTYNEALVVFRDVTSVSAAIRAMQVSVDGGSTYLTGGGDYADIATSGGATGVNALNLHATATTAARYSTALICTLRSPRAAKPVFVGAGAPPSKMVIGSGTAITHIRAVNWTGAATSNLNGGTVSIFAR